MWTTAGGRMRKMRCSLAHALELLQRASPVTAVPDQATLHSVVVRIVVHVNVGNAVL